MTQMRAFKLFIIVTIVTLLSPDMPLAQESLRPSDSNNVDETVLEELTFRMQKDPNDLDAFFRYANLSARHGKLKSAENAYLHMLKINPNLNRIKTALAIIYIRTGDKAAARTLLKEVLNSNPPLEVKNKIEATLASITKDTDDSENPPQEQAASATNELPEKYTQKQFLREVQKRIDPENRPMNVKINEAKKAEAEKNLDPQIKEAREQIKIIQEKIAKTPDNLDGYFALAKLAEKTGEFKTAEEAYLHMIEKAPKIDRIKLDLGLLYVKTGELEKAKSLFETVLANNPPEKVKENINGILEKVKYAMKTHIISGSASFGVNRDSNATSAASTGETTFSDISIPLAENSTKKEDAQIFATTSLSHLYKFDNNKSNIWSATFNTAGTLYKTSQTTEHQLDISLASIKSGPTLNLNKLKTQISAAGNLSIINLNSFKYLKTRGGELTLKYAPTSKLILDNTVAYEYRYFYNSPTSTNTGRTGNAYQNKVGATYVLTEKDILTSSLTWRNESAREAKNAFFQINLGLGYIRQLPYDITASASATFKRTHYDDFDTSISSTILRRDLEKTFTLALMKKLPKNISLTTSYQYKNSNSNIQNYTYDNHRVSTAVGWSF